MITIRHKYCGSLDEINQAIVSGDPEWEGLTDGDQIISISWDQHKFKYLVAWTTEEGKKQAADGVQ